MRIRNGIDLILAGILLLAILMAINMTGGLVIVPALARILKR
jgi:hypothetical protein